MTSVTMAPHAADERASNLPHLFFAAPIWKPHDHVRAIRDVRHETDLVVLEESPISVRDIMLYFGGGDAWSDFPVIDKPRFRLRIDAGSELALSGLTTDAALSRLSYQRMIAYDENTGGAIFRPERMAYNRAVFASFCQEHYPSIPVSIRRHGQSKQLASPYAFSSHDELLADAGGSVRLDYNYAFNGMALMKPVMAAYIRPDSGADKDMRLRTGCLAKHVADFYLRFGHAPIYRYPFHLQIIHALMDASPDERKSLYGWFLDGSVKVSLAGLYRDGLWIGSGKYAPIPIARIFENCMTALHGLGLIEILHGEREVRLGGNAVEMLGRFHKANRDPDIVSRFAKPGTLDIPLSQSDRVDDCIRRFFRKFKAQNDRH